MPNNVYGVGGLVSVQSGPILGNGAPPASFKGEVGQQWIDTSTSPRTIYIYNGATWSQNQLTLDTDGTFASASNSTASSSLAIKTYVDATASFGAPIASEVTQGIGFTASEAQVLARTANTATEAYFVCPEDLDAMFSSPSAIGDVAAGPATFSDLTADGTGAVSLTGNAASTLTNTSGDLTVDAQAGSLVLDSGEATADAVRIVASNAAGGLDVDGGTGGITIDSTGAVSIDAAGASNFSTSSGDLTFNNTSGAINVTSSEANSDSINVTSAGGMNIVATGAAGKDTVITNTNGSIHLTAGESVSDAINVDSSGGFDLDAAGQVNLTSSQNAADAIRLNASAGGIDIDAAGAAGEDITVDNAAGSITLTAGEAAADAVVITSTNGGMDLVAGGGAGLDTDITNTSGSVNITAGEAIATSMVLTSSAGGIDITAAGGAALDIDVTCTNGSVNITAGEAASDAFVLNASNAAGGVQIKAGTGGIAIGNEADTTPIGVGDFAPTASRTITIGGGTVVTAAVTDTIDIGPDGATTNADSVKTVNVNTGGVTTGQVLTNIATGTITSGTHTVGIQTGNAAAGTVATNLSTGTGTKTVNVGNADGLTTLNLDTVTLIADSVNANTSINTGTSTGTVSIGNAAAGAITVDSGAGISLDAATASNFACAAGDLTVDATAGSLILSSGESAADSIQIISDNGGIDISAAGAAAGEDIDITATGSSINLTSTEAVSDAIVISASDAAGGIVLDAGSGKVSVTGASLALTTAATQLQVEGGAATDFIGTATLVAGTVTVANTNIAATDRIFVQRNGVNASTTLGELDVSISAGASFTITSLITGTPGSTQTGDVSSVMYFIVRQL